jgi:hypothetical protein
MVLSTGFVNLKNWNRSRTFCLRMRDGKDGSFCKPMVTRERKRIETVFL